MRWRIAKLRQRLRGLARNSASNEPGDGLPTETTYGLGTLTDMAVAVKRVMLGLLVGFGLVLGACASDDSDAAPGSDSADRAVECPTADPADAIAGITQERADLLLGLREADAQRCAEDLGWAFRVGRRDEESFALTMDYSAQRVNVEVDDDIVTVIGVG